MVLVGIAGVFLLAGLFLILSGTFEVGPGPAPPPDTTEESPPGESAPPEQAEPPEDPPPRPPRPDLVRPAAPPDIHDGVRIPAMTVDVPPPSDGGLWEILVTHDGDVWCDLERRTPAGLARVLAAKADASREGEAPHCSLVGVTLTVDGRAPWRMVQWVMQTAAHPNTRIYRIWFTLARPRGARGLLPMWLPKDRGLSMDGTNGPRPDRQPATAELLVPDERGTDGPELTLVRLWPEWKKVPLGALDTALPLARKQLKTLAGRNAGAGVRITLPRDLPHAAAVRVIECARGAGIRNILLTGRKPPSDDAWESR